jgi:hypothetical protein
MPSAYDRNSKTEGKSSPVPGHPKDLNDEEGKDLSNGLKDFPRRGSDCFAYESRSAAFIFAKKKHNQNIHGKI